MRLLLAVAQHLLGLLRRHVEIEHEIRTWQLQLVIFKVIEPRKKFLALLRRDLGRLMHGV